MKNKQIIGLVVAGACIYCDRCYKRIDEYFICKYNGRRCDNDAGWRTGI